MKKIFLDTETTGLAPGQIGQLALIIEENTEIKTKNYFFEIDYIKSDAEAICGRGVDFYKQASLGKRFKDYKDELYDELSHGTLIAHNLKFDENFISTEFWRLNMIFSPEARFDTMGYFRDICKIPYKGSNVRFKNPKLEELINHFNINVEQVRKYSTQIFGNDDNTNTGFHDARYDTTAMFVCFHVYQDMLNSTNDWSNVFCVK